MSSFQQVILLGNLGQDPKLEATQGGTSVCKFSLATTESYKDRDGNRKEETSWHNIRAFGRLAELCSQYLVKGSKAMVSGRIRYSRSTGRDGVEKFFTDIIAADVKFLSPAEGTRPASSERTRRTETPTQTAGLEPAPNLIDDDIPF